MVVQVELQSLSSDADCVNGVAAPQPKSLVTSVYVYV